MAHHPEPFYWQQKGAWAVEIPLPNGKKRRKTLAKGPKAETEAEARRAYHAFMATNGARLEARDDSPFWIAVDIFLARIEGEVKPGTHQQYRIKLDDFAAFVGETKLSAIHADHAGAWIKARAWSPSTQRGAITAVKVCLNWCVERGLLEKNPLASVKRPKMGRRERILSPEERATIRSEFDDGFADFLDALTWTGCRPGEIMRLEAKHLDLEKGYAALPGKTTDATQELIEFPLIAPMLDLCRRLAERHPKGPIFRNADGNAWAVNAVRCRMRRLRQRTGLEGVTAYTFRHSFATDALERGVPITDVAALMNHRDIRTTMNYNHVGQRRAHLMRQAERAQGSALRPPAPGPADVPGDVGVGGGQGDGHP